MGAFEVVVWLSALLCVVITTWAAKHDSKAGGQSMRDSIVETWTNIFIGFAINFTANLVVLPMAGLPIGPMGAFQIGVVFTAISIIRTFVIRRWFNQLMVRKQRIQHGCS